MLFIKNRVRGTPWKSSSCHSAFTAKDLSVTLGQGTKIPQAAEPKKTKEKYREYCIEIQKYRNTKILHRNTKKYLLHKSNKPNT